MQGVQPAQNLSPAQRAIVEAPWDQNLLVRGAPGTGKTMALLNRAAHLRTHAGLPAKRILVMLFAKVHKGYLTSGLSDLQIPDTSLTTFDRWCIDIWNKGNPKSPLPWQTNRPNFEQIRTEAAKLVESGVRIEGDVVLVDEGQDLSQNEFRILGRASSHVSVFMDSSQDIFGTDCSESGIIEDLAIPETQQFWLYDRFRSPAASLLAEALIDTKDASQIVHRHPDGIEIPLIKLADSAKDELDWLADSIHSRMVLNENILILLPTRRQAVGLKRALGERGIDTELAIPERNRKLTVNFNGYLPKIATYHSAKGLTFDAVFLPSLVDKAFAGQSDDNRKRMIYIGISRARKWVCLSSYGRARIPELRRLIAIAKNQTSPFVSKLKRVKGQQPTADYDSEEPPLF